MKRRWWVAAACAAGGIGLVACAGSSGEAGVEVAEVHVNAPPASSSEASTSAERLPLTTATASAAASAEVARIPGLDMRTRTLITQIPSLHSVLPPGLLPATPATATGVPVAAGPRVAAITPKGTIAYDAGKPSVQPSSAPALNEVRDTMQRRAEITLLRIEVHTDSLGSDEFNLRLSAARAATVAKELVARGIDCKRLLPVGFGETRPIAPNDTDANRSANRRTTFEVATVRGRPVGGPVDGGGNVASDPCVP